MLVDRAIVTDDVDKIRAQVRKWIDDPKVEVVISTGGTGVTGRDVTPEAMEGLYEKRIEGFGETFRWISFQKIGTSTMQSRATAGVANGTYIFALPGSTGACKDGTWDDILRFQLDIRFRPCPFAELLHLPQRRQDSPQWLIRPFDGEGGARARAGAPALPATGTATAMCDCATAAWRIAYAHEGDASAAGRLHAQAAAFRHLNPAGRTPSLHEVIEPRAGLPGGALIVDFVAGRTPRLPDELALMADTLAASMRCRCRRQARRSRGRAILSSIRSKASSSTPCASSTEPCPMRTRAPRLPTSCARCALWRRRSAGARSRSRWRWPILIPATSSSILERLRGSSTSRRCMSARLRSISRMRPCRPRPYGIPMSAKCSVARKCRASTTSIWRASVRRSRCCDWWPGADAPARTTAHDVVFRGAWRVETRAPRDPSNLSQWSDAGLDARMKAHVDARIDQCFTRDVIRAIRGEWL